MRAGGKLGKIFLLTKFNMYMVKHTYHHTDGHHLLSGSQVHKSKCSFQVCRCRSEHNHQCLQCTHLCLYENKHYHHYNYACTDGWTCFDKWCHHLTADNQLSSRSSNCQLCYYTADHMWLIHHCIHRYLWINLIIMKIILIKNVLPPQDLPSPLSIKPSLQAHVYDPGVFWQIFWHSSVSSVHSLTSTYTKI